MMKLFALALIISLAGCVVSKSPVGDPISRVPEERLWNATWVDGNGSSFKTRLVNKDSGIVTVYDIALMDPTGKAMEVPATEVDVMLRQLGTLVLVANARDPRFKGEHLLFGRVAIKPDSLVIFAPSIINWRGMALDGIINGADVSETFHNPNVPRYGPHPVPTFMINGYSTSDAEVREAARSCNAETFMPWKGTSCRPNPELFNDLPDLVFVRQKND